MAENENVQELLQKLVSDLGPDVRVALADELARQAGQEAASVSAVQADLMDEYRQLIKGVPAGAYGNDQRFKAKLKIRQKASALGIPSPV